MKETPAGSPEPQRDFAVPDPSTTFVGDPSSAADQARREMLAAFLRTEEGRKVFGASASGRKWDPASGKWRDSSVPLAPDPTSFAHLEPEQASTAPTFSFPVELTEESVPDVEEDPPAEASNGIRRFWTWLTGG